MEKQIRLFTPQWSHIVPISSELFSSLLQPHLKTGVEVPDEIEIRGDPAIVIEEEWPHYLALESFMNEPTNPSEEGGIMTDSANDMPEGLVRVVNGSGAFGNHSTPIYLNSLQRLSHYLKFPQGWEKYVAVDEEVSNRTHHITAQGKAMMKSRPGMSFSEYIGEHNFDEDNFVLPFLAQMAKDEIKGSKREKEALEATFYGITRNAILRAYFKRKEGVDWTDVLWQDIPLLLSFATGKFGRARPSITTSGVLAGTSEKNTLPVTYPIRTPPITSQGLSLYHLAPGSYGDSVEQVSMLYDRLLKVFSPNVDPERLGVPLRLLYDKNYTLVTDFLLSERLDSIVDLVTWINQSTIAFYLGTRYRTKDARHPLPPGPIRSPTEEDYPRIVELMAITTVGKNGLVAILLSLLHQLEKKHNDKVDKFASEIEKYLEEHPDEEDYPRLILSMDNKRVKDIILRDL